MLAAATNASTNGTSTKVPATVSSDFTCNVTNDGLIFLVCGY